MHETSEEPPPVLDPVTDLEPGPIPLPQTSTPAIPCNDIFDCFGCIVGGSNQLTVCLERWFSRDTSTPWDFIKCSQKYQIYCLFEVKSLIFLICVIFFIFFWCSKNTGWGAQTLIKKIVRKIFTRWGSPVLKCFYASIYFHNQSFRNYVSFETQFLLLCFRGG